MTEPKPPPERLEDMETAYLPTTGTVARMTFVDVKPLPTMTTRSFESFYKESYVDVVRALSLTLGNQGWGQEAADEAMTRAFDRWADLAGYENPTGWAYRVGLNWARSWHRKLSRRLPWADEPVSLPESSDLSLAAALAALDLKYRSVVVCRYLLDWSTQDTAAALELAPGTVKSRLSVGLTRLRAELGEPPSATSDTEA